MVTIKVHLIFSMAIILTVFQGCASFKKELIQSGNRKEAIQNAILDFSNSGGLYRKDSVFSVSFLDTVYRMVLNKVDERNYRWVNGEFYKEMVAVKVSASSYQFLLTEHTTIGSKGKLPSRFIEKDGKIFYWWDDDYSLTEETLAVFRKYNLLQDDQGGVITVPEFTNDDAQKAAHYYFCRNDLTKYKKIVTNKGMGYYDPPKLECGG